MVLLKLVGGISLILLLGSLSPCLSLDPPPDQVLVDVFGPSEGSQDYCHRRPALLLTTGRTLLAFAERAIQEEDGGRCWQSAGATVSVVVKRSKDGGSTWSAAEVVIAGSTVDTVGKCEAS